MIFSLSISIVAAVLALACLAAFFNRKLSGLRHKWWLLVLAVAALVIAAAGLFEIRAVHARRRTRVSIGETRASATVKEAPPAAEVFTAVILPDCQLLLPPGYKYSKYSTGPVLMTAYKPAAEIGIVKLDYQATIEEALERTCDYMLKNNAKCIFRSRQPVEAGPARMMRADFSLARSGVPETSIFVFFQEDGPLYQLQFSCAQKDFEKEGRAFFDVIQSFSLR
jgi:hypothetical protein